MRKNRLTWNGLKKHLFLIIHQTPSFPSNFSYFISIFDFIIFFCLTVPILFSFDFRFPKILFAYIIPIFLNPFIVLIFKDFICAYIYHLFSLFSLGVISYLRDSPRTDLYYKVWPL